MAAKLPSLPPVPPPPPDKPFTAKDSYKAIDLSRSASVQQALFRGMVVYIQHPGLTIRNVWENYRLDDDDETAPWLRDMVNYSTFERQAVRGKWTKKRDDFWYGVEQRVLAEAQTEAVKKELDEITHLEAIAGHLIQTITGGKDRNGKLIDPTKPKSLEGVVNAYLHLDKHRMGKRERVMAAMAAAATTHERPETGGAHTDPDLPFMEDELTEDEIETMARQLAMRRAGVKELPATIDNSAYDDEADDADMIDVTEASDDDDEWPEEEEDDD
jgi:hypothetical protein